MSLVAMQNKPQKRTIICCLLVIVAIFVFNTLEELQALFQPLPTTISKAKYEATTNTLGCVVLLAPPRSSIFDGSGVERTCLLTKAIQSVDQHLNSRYGPYPIYVVVAKDWEMDPGKADGEYTQLDREVIQSFAPNSEVHFQEVNLYSEDALEPNTNASLILKWVEGYDNSVEGRNLGYRSMCRLWSGRLQHMDFMKQHEFYMRLDDDSLMTGPVPEDPFLMMKHENLSYLWRQNVTDYWGIDKLWNVSQKHVTVTPDTPFLTDGNYRPGWQPYNNFHISSVAFWSSPKWMALWNELNEEHGFFKYRMGDANVHAMAVMLLNRTEYKFWEAFPYGHNYGIPNYPQPEWKFECELAQKLLAKKQENTTSTATAVKSSSSAIRKNNSQPPDGKRAVLIPDICETSAAMSVFEKMYQEGNLQMLHKEDFYSNAKWPPKSRDADSGGGSQLGEATETSLDILRKTIVKFNVSTMIDAPCGDTKWIFDSWETDSLKLYIGLDVAKGLIERNSERMHHHFNKIFAHWDVTKCRLPKFKESLGSEPRPAELIHSRDIFQHLPLQEGLAFLCNIMTSDAQVLVATTYLNSTRNVDIKPGEWSKINLHLFPFNLPDPGNCVETHPIMDQDYTCVYNLSGGWRNDWINEHPACQHFQLD